MKIAFSHKAVAHLLIAISVSDTLLTVDVQAFQSFMRPGLDYIYALIRGPVNRELVKIDVAASSEQQLSVERGQGGTSAYAWPMGSVLFATTHEDHYNAIIQAGAQRTIDYNPNEILSPLYAGEKVYQSGPSGCERWWKSFNAVNPYWDIITGAPCSEEVYKDIAWTYELLMPGDPWSDKLNLTYADPVRWIYSLCYDSSRHNLFAGTKYGGHIFKSTDGGATWSHCYDTGDDRVRSLIYDAYHDTLVAGTGSIGAVWVSDDGGDTWTEEAWMGQEVTTLCYAPDTHTLIAGTYTSAKIYKSTDGGYNWVEKQNLGTPAPYEAYVSALTYDTSRSRFICGTGLNAGSLWTSDDDGDTWTKRKNLQDEVSPEGRILSMCYDSANDVVLCGTYNDGQIWKSLDGGINWSFVIDLSDESPAQYSVDAMIFVPGSDIIFAGTAYNAQVWLSENGGLSWVMEQGLSNYTIYAFAHDPYHSKVVAAASAAFSEDCIIWTRDH